MSVQFRHNTTQDEMISYLYCRYLELKDNPDGGGQQVIFPVANYLAAEAIATGDPKIIVVAVDETQDGAKTTYFWDGTTMALIVKLPPLIKKEQLGLEDPEFDQDPVTLSFLNTELDAIDEILEQLQQAGNQDAIALWQQLQELAYPDMVPNWNAIEVITTGATASGATSNTSEGTITVPTGSTGAGTYLRKDFKIDNNPNNKNGDIIQFEVIMRESFVGALSPHVVISLTKNGTPVPIEVSATVMGPKVIQYLFNHTIDDISDALSVRVTLDGTSPASTTNTIYTWNSLAYSSPREWPATTVENVARTLRNSDYMYSFFARAAKTTKANIYNTVDNTARMQDEIYDAIQTSGVYLIPKNATMYMGSPLVVNGSLNIVGAGVSSIFNNAMNGTLFNIQTNDEVIFENFQIYRLLGQFVAKALEFNSAYQNKRSIFRNIIFSNMQDPVSLNYADTTWFDRCEFRAGVNGINIGDKSTAGITGVTIQRCKFSGYSGIGINALAGNDMTIDDNEFTAPFATNFYSMRAIQVAVSDNTTENLKISFNKIKYFREVAMRLYVGGTGQMNHSQILGNQIIDNSSLSESQGIWASSVTPGAARNMCFTQNRFTTKNEAILAQSIYDLDIRGNKFYNHGNATSYPSARGIKLTSCPDPKQVNNNIYGADLQPNIL